MKHDLKWFKKREAELREATRKLIEAEDKVFRQIEPLTKGQKLPRHPHGKDAQAEREGFWNDAIWCQDITLDPLELVFSVDLGDDGEEFYEYVSEGGEVIDWANDIFSEEFEKICPDLVHLLEG